MTLDLTFGGRLRIPLIVAPMFLVSNPALTLAACSRGVMGSFPAHSTRTRDIFIEWLDEMERGLAEMDSPAPWAVNLVVHPTNERCEGDLELCIERKVPVILTSKGAPNDVFKRIHDYGGVAFHDIASARHAEKAAEAGADALIAVCGGAGGHTGTINPFALINEVREVTDKPIILSGALSTGSDILAAQAMGADLAYMGTRFIATRETLSDDYTRQVMIECTAKDVFFSAALDGAPANWLKPTMIAEGLNPDEIGAYAPGKRVENRAAHARYSKIKSAGHGVGMIKSIESATDLCDQLVAEYENARLALADRLQNTNSAAKPTAA